MIKTRLVTYNLVSFDRVVADIIDEMGDAIGNSTVIEELKDRLGGAWSEYRGKLTVAMIRELDVILRGE